jgi:hypothetical protein
VAYNQSTADTANQILQANPNEGVVPALLQAGVPQDELGDYAVDFEGRIVDSGFDASEAQASGVPLSTAPGPEADIVIVVQPEVDPEIQSPGGTGTDDPAFNPSVEITDLPTNEDSFVTGITSGVGNAISGIGETISGIAGGIADGIGYGADVITGFFEREEEEPQSEPQREGQVVTFVEPEDDPRPQPQREPPVLDVQIPDPEVEPEFETPVQQPAPVIEGVDDLDAQDGVGPGNLGDPEDPAESILNAARNQAAIKASLNTNPEDWRVKLQLAPGATYLYKDPSITSFSDSVLFPLQQSDGVIFPYTPSINVISRADYGSLSPTHNNYRYYFYKSSSVEPVYVSAEFTAQDTREANYLLAVITFFKSVTKMFYGQDAERGAPPPLVYMTGLGQYQFNNHPCLVSQFIYNLPSDVDYIRADTQQIRGSLQQRRQLERDNSYALSWDSIWSRLSGSGLNRGARQTSFNISGPNLTEGQTPTYVPTEIRLEFELLPVVNRKVNADVFSLKEFGKGKLINRGIW